jgi:hypothetical protein
MKQALFNKLPNNPIKRICRTTASHKVLFYELSNTYRVVGLESTMFIRRDNPCRTVFTGSEQACENYKNKRNG